MQNNQELSLEQINEIRQQGLRPVVVGCFINDQKLLLVYKEEYGLWFLPQGGIKNKETISDAIKREMTEELGSSFFSKADQFYIFLDENIVKFPLQNRGNRDLFTDQAGKIFMKGKKYFFYIINTATQELNVSETEFNNYQWVDFEQGKKLAEQIYQKGKKRITLDVLELLKNNNFIK
ncbi:NUDIX hydrolase [Patescibacteria group bacterium]